MLQKKSALITGGTAGIGFGIACSLCDRGYSLTNFDVDSTPQVKAKNDLEKRQPNSGTETPPPRKPPGGLTVPPRGPGPSPPADPKGVNVLRSKNG